MNNGKLVFISSVLTLALTAGWQERVQAATIKQLIIGEDSAAVLMDEKERESQIQYFLATYQGRQCRLPVVTRQELIAKLSTKDCPFRDQLAIGQTVELPILNEPPPPKTEAPVITEAGKDTSVKPVQPQEHKDTKAEIPIEQQRSMMDLNFVPYKGQSFANLSMTSRKYNERATVSGVTYYDSSDEARQLQLSYVYGVTDRLAIGVIEPILLSDDTDIKYGPASTTNGQNDSLVADGFGDPTIGFNYRGLEQSNISAMSLDIMVGYLAKVQDAKAPSNIDKGNAGRGGDGYLIDFELQRKTDLASFKVELEFTSLNTRTRKSGSLKLSTTGGNQTAIGLATQLKLSESAALEAAINEILVSSSEQKSDSSSYSIEGYNYSTFGLGFKVVLAPETCFLNLGVVQYNEVSTNYKSGTSVLKDTADAHQNYTLGLNFLF